MQQSGSVINHGALSPNPGQAPNWERLQISGITKVASDKLGRFCAFYSQSLATIEVWDMRGAAPSAVTCLGLPQWLLQEVDGDLSGLGVEQRRGICGVDRRNECTCMICTPNSLQLVASFSSWTAQGMQHCLLVWDILQYRLIQTYYIPSCVISMDVLSFACSQSELVVDLVPIITSDGNCCLLDIETGEMKVIAIKWNNNLQQYFAELMESSPLETATSCDDRRDTKRNISIPSSGATKLVAFNELAPCQFADAKDGGENEFISWSLLISTSEKVVTGQRGTIYCSTKSSPQQLVFAMQMSVEGPEVTLSSMLLQVDRVFSITWGVESEEQLHILSISLDATEENLLLTSQCGLFKVIALDGDGNNIMQLPLNVEASTFPEKVSIEYSSTEILPQPSVRTSNARRVAKKSSTKEIEKGSLLGKKSRLEVTPREKLAEYLNGVLDLGMSKYVKRISSYSAGAAFFVPNMIMESPPEVSGKVSVDIKEPEVEQSISTRRKCCVAFCASSTCATNKYQNTLLHFWCADLGKNPTQFSENAAMIGAHDISGEYSNVPLPTGGFCMLLSCKAFSEGGNLLIGVDSAGGVWIMRSLRCNDFAGPMYPVGFKLMTKVEPYIEAEDELDKTVSITDYEQQVEESAGSKNEDDSGIKLQVSTDPGPFSSCSLPNSNGTFTDLKLSYNFIEYYARMRDITSAAKELLAKAGVHLNNTMPVSRIRTTLSSQRNLKKRKALSLLSPAREETRNQDVNALVEEERGSGSTTTTILFKTGMPQIYPVPSRISSGMFKSKFDRFQAERDSLSSAVENEDKVSVHLQKIREGVLNTIHDQEKNRLKNLNRSREKKESRARTALNHALSESLEIFRASITGGSHLSDVNMHDLEEFNTIEDE